MQRTYPEGVPSWVDLESPDLGAAQEFYGGLFGWTFEAAPGPRADGAYVVARLDGRASGPAGVGRGGDDAPTGRGHPFDGGIQVGDGHVRVPDREIRRRLRVG